MINGRIMLKRERRNNRLNYCGLRIKFLKKEVTNNNPKSTIPAEGELGEAKSQMAIIAT